MYRMQRRLKMKKSLPPNPAIVEGSIVYRQDDGIYYTVRRIVEGEIKGNPMCECVYYDKAETKRAEFPLSELRRVII